MKNKHVSKIEFNRGNFGAYNSLVPNSVIYIEGCIVGPNFAADRHGRVDIFAPKITD